MLAAKFNVADPQSGGCCLFCLGCHVCLLTQELNHIRANLGKNNSTQVVVSQQMPVQQVMQPAYPQQPQYPQQPPPGYPSAPQYPPGPAYPPPPQNNMYVPQ